MFLRREEGTIRYCQGVLSQGDFVASSASRLSSEWAGTLIEPQQSLAAVLGSSAIGLAVCDRQMRFRAINRALASMNGIPARAHISKKLHQILGSAAGRVGSAFEDVFKTGEPLSNIKLTAQLPARSGIGHWIEDYYPIKNTSGKVVQVGAIVLEVSTKNRIGQPLTCLTRRQLSSRERQVIRLVAEGKPNREIATALGISVRTVETYRARMMLKLDLHSIADVARYAVFNKII
jgi:two-component system, chemotaxis family, CheB/CheR fusion protein